MLMKRKFTLLFTIISIYCASAQNWSSLGTDGLNGSGFRYVNCFTEYNGNVVVGGRFLTAGGTTVNHVAIWNGTSWEAMGNGVATFVKTLIVYNGELYAGLEASTGSVVKWNPGNQTWTTSGSFNGNVNAFCIDTQSNTLFAGGNFTAPGSLVAKFNGTTWSNTANGLANGQFPVVNSLIYFNGSVYAGGAYNPSSSTIRNIAKFSGTSWVTAGANMPNNAVQAMEVYKGKLYIAGSFSTVGTINSSKIAVLETAGFTSIANVSGSGFNDDIFDIIYYNGELYCVGNFTSNSSTSLTRIARYNGYEWKNLGTDGLDDGVNALGNVNDTLYVGGYFTSAGGNTNYYVAKWYNPLVGCNNADYFEYDDDVDIFESDSCKTLKIYGCLDTNYFEYNPNANFSVNDSCKTLKIFGCSDENYLEYNAAVNFPIADSCKTLKIFGCMDANYLEYNPNANVNVEDSCLTILSTKKGLVKNNKLNVFPNPAKDNVTIVSSLDLIKTIQLLDLKGTIIYQLNQVNSNKIDLELNNELNLPDGIYSLKITTENTTLNKKFVKQ
jgi:hypothetical protein